VNPSRELYTIVADELAQPVPVGARVLTEKIRERFGKHLRAVLFYGSCQRRQVDDEGILDLYALVDDYRASYSNPLLVLANRILPPNVFYLEAGDGQRSWRAKYAVLSLDDLAWRTTARSFEPYFWARFAQPCTLIWAADDAIREQVANALVASIRTFLDAGIPLVAPHFDSQRLWIETWRHTYRAELRSERPEVVEKLWNNAAARYERVTELALQQRTPPAMPRAGTDGGSFAVPITAAEQRRAQRSWRWRIASAKLRFLARILRNALIFEGGIDYILWKIARHSQASVDYDWRTRRWPYLSLLGQLWRLYRDRAFH